MQDTKVDTGMWQTRATAWELLALSFRYPDIALAEAVASGEWAEAAIEIAEALDVSLPEDFASTLVAYVGVDSATLLHTLRADATRLFVGAPEPVVSPFEGVARAKAEGVQALLFVNPHSMDVERFMKSCGMGRPKGTNEPLDHVATECEFLQLLAAYVAGFAALPESLVAPAFPGGSISAAYESFMEEHALVWMPQFAEGVQNESREPFYRAAAVLLQGVAV